MPTQADAEDPELESLLSLGTMKVPVTEVIPELMMTAPAQFEEYWTCVVLTGISMMSAMFWVLGAIGRLCLLPVARLAILATRRSELVGAARAAPVKARRPIAWKNLMIDVLSQILRWVSEDRMLFEYEACWY